MKSTIKVKAIFSLILITCALLFITCENPDVEEESGMGEFTINLSAGISRAAYPPNDVTGGNPSGPMLKDLRLEVTFTETEGTSPKTIPFTYTGDRKITGTIAEGRYTVTMKVYLISDNSIYALGSAINSAVGIVKGTSNATIDLQLYDASLTPTVWVSKDGGTPVSYPNLKVALDFNTTPGDYTVTLDGGVPHSITPTALYGTGRNITLISKELSIPAEVQLSSNGYLFAVNKDVSLTLDSGITLRGRNFTDDGEDNIESVILVYSYGTLIMKTGSLITGNSCPTGSYASVGGVYVNKGTFTMEGGEISGNEGYDSGGVFLEESTSTMSGGEISGNTGNGGVHLLDGTFTMSGGEISGNEAHTGGGVWVLGGTFTMSGGEISGNTASNVGGGVNVFDGTFTMSDGEISGNEALGGGGVYMRNGTFTMSGGEISGNVANYDGGGVTISGGTFTISSSLISGNTAGEALGSGTGGGICVFAGDFIMIDGEISGNTALGVGSGGGVYVSSGVGGGSGYEIIAPATFTMESGEISGNDANYGGGIALNLGTFTMNGGDIYGNSATIFGGGIQMNSGSGLYVSGDLFTMNDGIIHGNSAGNLGGGVFVDEYGTFIKSATGGIIRGYGDDTTNGNVVGGGTPGNTMGHAVWAQGGGTLYRDNTVIATEALGWDGATGTSSGTW